MEHSCERCQKIFRCEPMAIERCQCSQWQLSIEVKAKIAKDYGNCLCASCLEQLGAVKKKTSFAANNAPLNNFK